MSAEKIAGISLSSLALVGGGYLGLRAFMRHKVHEALVVEYEYPQLRRKLYQFTEPFGIDIGLPTAEEFAASLVPIADYATPFAAIDDVLAKGRKSKYWPAKYKKTPKGGEKIEPILFKAMAAAYNTPSSATSYEMAREAIAVLAAEALSGKLSRKR
jgi:hypothetical protein